MLRGSIHRQHVNWQRLMWRGGGPARLLTGEIIANKGTPLRVIDRLQGRPPPARKPCFMDRDSVQIQTHAYAQTCTFICMYTCTHTQTFTLLTGCSLFKECSQLFGCSSATHDQIRSLFLKLMKRFWLQTSFMAKHNKSHKDHNRSQQRTCEPRTGAEWRKSIWAMFCRRVEKIRNWYNAHCRRFQFRLRMAAVRLMQWIVDGNNTDPDDSIIL